MAVAILDTSIYIDHWQRGLYQETLENLRRAYIIRHSAVVLSDFGAALAGVRQSALLPTFTIWPRSDGNRQWPTGGKQAGLSETSVTTRTGI
jgi:hypothetical protein